VAAACRLLEQETPMTLEALARQLAVSPFHFHRLFKSVTGMTPKAWQQAWRARRLREALGQGRKLPMRRSLPVFRIVAATTSRLMPRWE
jgi:AraC family transcriptional regulator of adaptative response/methylated-DNA-[protein]-cysteine methyltransferase